MIRNTDLYFPKTPLGKVDTSHEKKVFYDNETLSQKIVDKVNSLMILRLFLIKSYTNTRK